MECLSRPDSTHVRLVAFNNAAKNTQSSICSYLVLLFTKHTLSHYRPASYHLAMASYASCRANSLALQYITLVLIGLVAFLLALYPVEKALLRSSWLKKKSLVPLLILVTNFFIGLGIVLGRVQRINSWDVIVDIPKVIGASVSIFNSLEMILFVLFFGVFANVYYFVCRKSFQVS